MRSVKLRNMETGESVWLNIPSSYQASREAFAGLGNPGTVQIVSAEMEEPSLEKHLAGKLLRRENGVKELEFLELRLEGLTAQEKELFFAALEIEEPRTMMEIVNLSCNLDKFTVYAGAVDEKALGDYLLEHRKDVMAEYVETQAEAAGRRYVREHSGCFSESGYVFRSGKALQAVYDGKYCPDPAYDSNAVFIVTVPREHQKGGRRMLSLALPASDEKLAVAAENLGVADVGECIPSGMESNDRSLTSHLPITYDIRGLNEYARLLQSQGMTGKAEVMKKLYAALEAELPADMDEAVEIAGNLDRYRFLPTEVKEPSVYARYVLQDWLPQVDERLDEFIDFEGYGKYRMRADGVVQTGYGMLERTDRPLSQLTEEVASLKLFSPLEGSLFARDEWREIPNHGAKLDSYDLGIYEAAIREMVEKDCRELGNSSGLAPYIHNCLLRRKAASMMPTVESWEGRLWGVLEVKLYGELTDGELEELKQDWTGQASDGWGEGFEQCPIEVSEGELYVSFWHSGSDYFIKTEEELKNPMCQSFSMQMGGM